ncbi:DNA segregation ATPase FtsK/SpoIIIE, S-DNA-T family [Lutibacter oricola]|uniref:DNA segregation ATPase FtsK/SpoIIIE, S-DNA-T family n=1 Tax=Lutibacter oricola TaxID=762486 RepID=A0A1H3AP14_9FLAO|nr:DNA translocase FtsK [Lutibacter oricola]SDX31490.1 DNA segregation ATPase FtsK/SpoIIIE, S-DNA-T family [Lutibacter oricola]
MAKTKKTTVKKERKPRFQKIKAFFGNRQTQTIIGAFIVFFSVFLLISFISYLFSWKEDQSQLANFADKKTTVKNLLGKIGAGLSHFFIYKSFGISSLYLPFLLFFSGLLIFLKGSLARIKNNWGWGILGIIWFSIAFGFLANKSALLPGVIGFETNHYLQQFLGKTGLVLALLFLLVAYLVVRFKITPEKIKKTTAATIAANKIDKTTSKNTDTTTVSEPITSTKTEEKNNLDLKVDNIEPIIKEEPFTTTKSETVEDKELELTLTTKPSEQTTKDETTEDVEIAIEQVVEEKHVEENLSDKIVKDFGEFDPTLELGSYAFPTLNLLKDYNETISVNQEELEANKNRIVETLNNYKIGIAKIKATVGPTVTLYEIIPDAGIRISKIKNLEDDIALSLSALGIRIIAPIPGKGTIGIEVPNKKPTMVSMKSVISSAKFQESEMELPIALGKSISNETFVVDLAKMPHMLMAGATGQGKSVGLNAVLTSLLYKKHPAEVKFVLVDPKKVELTLFNHIERHYLAKLPDSEEAIITDTTKVINTLNSLCIEMDARYDMLKLAMVRNIKEYNAKFKARKLNPENGHKFLPYIVLVIDEFADLIMTAGKEVETPIARLAQLARAIGIHLIVATQRPSVNVITGIIKANFPARAAFRVTSKIDSRTILDAPGADQLIGKGDMLYSGGNEVIRLQCAFVDTPEVEKITDFIGSQRAYPEAHLLPEYVGEEVGTSLDINISERDKLFRDAALLIVHAQQGSASLLQRKLKLGYNRAGRLIDQLEAAGIVGPFEGSKARQVLIPDEMALNQLLDNEGS